MSGEELDRAISDHYGWPGLMEAIESEIRLKGINPQDVTITQLAPLDNYHWLRLAGTLALAEAAAINADERVLDVGGGIGGPARQLASRFGCHVTVLDVTPEYCAVGEKLTDWTRLADRVAFVQASALDMPFADASFDVIWTQHATMNIPDKQRLYSEMARVVRPGGRFAMFDVLAGPHQPIHFPVPWASDESFSFLLPPEETRDLIARVGFRELTWMTDEDQAMEAVLAQPDPLADATPAGEGLDPGLLNGPDGPRMGANVQRNMEEGRIRFAMGVFERR